MTASRDINAARPTTQNRLSVGSPASSLSTARQRPHSHSLSVGSINPTHRVSRRKSTSATNNAAVMAAVKGAAGSPVESGGLNGRRNASSKGAAGPRGLPAGSFAAVPSSLPNSASGFGQSGFIPSIVKDGSAVTDGPPLASMPENAKASNKSRIRRASEGSRLSKGDAKRTSGSDLRCEKCGKGYKHSSCLTKHLWEHTPEWAITSKLLISKHQQVQLLEAASVLVTMNQEKSDSEHSSASPAASSDAHEEAVSSNDTTPPPQLDEVSAESYHARNAQFQPMNRRTSNSSAYSHSYQSQSSVFSESVSSGRPYLSHFRQWSSETRPTTSATAATSVTDGYDQEDQADLAAAVGLLSCSYGTPKSGPVMLPADVPPVPPLPAKFLGQNTEMQTEKVGILQPYTSNERSYGRYDRQMKDADMEDDFMDEDDFDRHSRSRSDEDDEGMFGRMEE